MNISCQTCSMSHQLKPSNHARTETYPPHSNRYEPAINIQFLTNNTITVVLLFCIHYSLNTNRDSRSYCWLHSSIMLQQADKNQILAAAKEGDINTIQQYSSQTIQQTTDSSGCTPLHWAAGSNHLPLLQYLLNPNPTPIFQPNSDFYIKINDFELLIKKYYYIEMFFSSQMEFLISCSFFEPATEWAVWDR